MRRSVDAFVTVRLLDLYGRHAAVKITWQCPEENIHSLLPEAANHTESVGKIALPLCSPHCGSEESIGIAGCSADEMRSNFPKL